MEAYERTSFYQSCRGIGDGMQAKGTITREVPAVIAVINWQLARHRPGRLGWRRGS